MRRLIAAYLFTALALFAAWQSFAQAGWNSRDSNYNIAIASGGGSCNPPLLSCVTVPSGLAGWWPLDTSTTSAPTTNDLSGNANNGTFQNSPSLTTGQIQQAVSLNGSSQYVQMTGTNTGALDFTGSFSLCAWVFITAGGDKGIMTKGYDGSNTQYELTLDATTNTVSFNTYNGAVHGVTSSTTFSFSTWQFWCGTFDGSTWRIYLNASLDNSSSDSTAPTHVNKPLLVGALDLNGTISRQFGGDIDDPRAYNRALSGAEITSIYNSGLAGRP